ncbi:MAG: bifunctional phosphopantothenoylcysteine decarboxylase/phosphopantothenate--cysteine ligase CoaBC, partial [Prochlorothrix sp.]
MNSLQPVPTPWIDRRILLGITGGIAAYKLCTVASTLAKAGAQVRPLLTHTAQEFITPLTLSTLCRHRAYTDLDFWAASAPRPLHIELGEWAEALVIAPLTANTLAKLALGFADNLLTNTVLASRCPVLLIPAMNTDMWEQPVVQEHWHSLLDQARYVGLAPGTGLLACDRQGAGRMAEPVSILAALESLLANQGIQDWRGQRVLVTAGGTQEYWDPVRFLGNPATGRMGVALAQAAAHRGAEVTLIQGTGLETETLSAALEGTGVQCVRVTRSSQLEEALQHAFPRQDWVFMAAAVADLRPGTYHGTKLPKAQLPEQLPLEPVPDLIAALARQKQPHQRLIGFAAQTGDILPPAREKLRRKGLDAIVANPVDRRDVGFGSPWNQAVMLDRSGRQQAISPCTKLTLAHHILDFVQDLPSGDAAT